MKKVLIANSLGFMIQAMTAQKITDFNNKENTEFIEYERGVGINSFSEKSDFERNKPIKIKEKGKSKYHK